MQHVPDLERLFYSCPGPYPRATRR